MKIIGKRISWSLEKRITPAEIYQSVFEAVFTVLNQLGIHAIPSEGTLIGLLRYGSIVGTLSKNQIFKKWKNKKQLRWNKTKTFPLGDFKHQIFVFSTFFDSAIIHDEVVIPTIQKTLFKIKIYLDEGEKSSIVS